MGITARIASLGGDTWRSWRMLALWPWPAVIIGLPHVKFTFSDYRFFTYQIRPGDFLVTTSEPYFLSNRAIAGTAFKHLAIYVGAVEGYRDRESGYIMKPKSLGPKYEHKGAVIKGVFERTIVNAISSGVVVQDLGDLLFHADYAAIVRPWMDDEQQAIIIEEALKQVGREYDFKFNPNTPEKFFCTELGVYCAARAGITPPFKDKVSTSLLSLLSDRFKTNITLADSFLKYPVVGCSVSCNEPKFPRKSRYDTLRAVLLDAPDASR